MSFERTLILQLVILAVVLESDLGRKKIGLFRLLRPVVAAVAVGVLYLKTLPAGGHDDLLMAAGAVLGIVLGLLSVCPALVSVEFDAHFVGTGRFGRARAGDRGTPAAVSRSGFGYAAIWIAAAAARLLFAYGSQHVFPHALGVFLTRHQLSADALTDALIFYAVGMDLFRSAGLWVRRASAMRAGRVASQLATTPR